MTSIFMSASMTQIKYCDTCRIYRPPRTSHCKECDRCVSGYDHHCSLLGTCIGRNNYRHFFLFLCCSSVLVITIFIQSLCILFRKRMYEVSSAEQNSSTILVLSVVVLAAVLNFMVPSAHQMGISILILNGYHCYLLYHCQTTKENIKKVYSEGLLNPHKKHPCISFWNLIVCGSRSPICHYVPSSWAIEELRKKYNCAVNPPEEAQGGEQKVEVELCVQITARDVDNNSNFDQITFENFERNTAVKQA